MNDMHKNIKNSVDRDVDLKQIKFRSRQVYQPTDCEMPKILWKVV